MSFSPVGPLRKVLPLLENRVGLKIKAGGFLSKTLVSVRQYLESFAQDGLLVNEGFAIVLTATVVVPAASKTHALATITVFAFVHAIILKAPFRRVKVEAEAAAPLATATTEIVFARPTGAA